MNEPSKSEERVLFVHAGPEYGPGEQALLSCLVELSKLTRVEVAAESGEPFVDHARDRGLLVHDQRFPRPHRTRGFRRALQSFGATLAEGTCLYHASTRVAALYSGLVAREAGVPVIWHLRDQQRAGIRTRVLRRLTHCWVASARALLERAGILPSHPYARVVPHGLPPNLIRSESQPLWERETGPVIGMLGSLRAVHGQHLFLDMAKRVARKRPGASFVIAGDLGIGTSRATRRYADSLAQLVRQWGLEGRVQFMAYPPDFCEFLDTLDLFVLPSLHEGFGHYALQAMARGLPVLGTQVGGIPELITSGDNGWLVPPKDSRALAQACMFLAGHPHITHQIGERGRQWAIERHSIDKVARSMVGVYQELAAQLV